MNEIANRIITKSTDNIKNHFSELLASFFSGVVSIAEDEIQKTNTLNMANQGNIHECISNRLKETTELFHKEFNKIQLFSEEEMRSMFNRYYSEYWERNYNVSDIEISPEELYKRFRIYVNSYVKNFAQKMSFGEKRILERTSQINTKLDKVLYKEDFEKTSMETTNLLKKLLKDKDEPLISISNIQSIKIYPFEAKYVFCNNTFDFYDGDRENCYVISLSLTNIGRCMIENLEISDCELIYCKEMYDDNPELAYYIMPASLSTQNKLKTLLNIMPESNQKIHLIINKDELEANNNDEDFYEEYLNGSYPFDYKNMQLKFKIMCKGDIKSNTYEVTLFISKIYSTNNDDIIGLWDIDFVSMKIINN